jgi:hypothetical protein
MPGAKSSPYVSRSVSTRVLPFFSRVCPSLSRCRLSRPGCFAMVGVPFQVSARTGLWKIPHPPSPGLSLVTCNRSAAGVLRSSNAVTSKSQARPSRSAPMPLSGASTGLGFAFLVGRRGDRPSRGARRWQSRNGRADATTGYRNPPAADNRTNHPRLWPCECKKEPGTDFIENKSD